MTMTATQPTTVVVAEHPMTNELLAKRLAAQVPAGSADTRERWWNKRRPRGRALSWLPHSAGWPPLPHLPGPPVTSRARDPHYTRAGGADARTLGGGGPDRKARHLQRPGAPDPAATAAMLMAKQAWADTAPTQIGCPSSFEGAGRRPGVPVDVCGAGNGCRIGRGLDFGAT